MAPSHKRREFLIAVGTASAIGFAGCLGDGGNGGGNDTGNGGGSKRLSWHAGGTGGTYYPLSNEFKTIVEENTDFTLQVQSTGASVENVGSLADGSADFALIQNDIASFAKNGTGIDAFKGNAVKNLMGVATLYPETITVVTQANSGIKKLSDLSGKRINTGDLGSGTQVNALQILEAVGVTDFTEQNSGFSQATNQLKNGDIDAAFVVGGWPVGAIEELASTNDIALVPISGETRKTVMNSAEWFSEDTIPAGTYSGVDTKTETVAVQAMIATHEGVSEKTVETVTAAIFDNTGDLSTKTDYINKKSAQDGMSIELHPGAKTYFESNS